MASLLTLTFSQPTRPLKAGETLISEGDPGGTLFVLETGKLVVERDGVTIATISEPGALVGEMSVLLGTPNTATVRAVEPSAVRVVRDALAYLERQPLVALRVATILSQRLDATSAILVEMRKTAPEKAPEHGIVARLFGSLMAGPAA